MKPSCNCLWLFDYEEGDEEEFSAAIFDITDQVTVDAVTINTTSINHTLVIWEDQGYIEDHYEHLLKIMFSNELDETDIKMFVVLTDSSIEETFCDSNEGKFLSEYFTQMHVTIPKSYK